MRPHVVDVVVKLLPQNIIICKLFGVFAGLEVSVNAPRAFTIGGFFPSLSRLLCSYSFQFREIKRIIFL